ncbi:uncharacterized protein B0H18DRAFT_417265 [Fomitopsis serialis]|uniref:uncharacterized protein n=1 Tax=Fomitopsis serialis TaxID=139415 RepID=UPI0020072B10|nr:uncharacterized protein B0H18DRAFT_417265 [Neoantrodia serialis]KAH9935579.1 hypothetical protein B0H18DRAFT_417265 [Neoantrodia serialis]
MHHIHPRRNGTGVPMPVIISLAIARAVQRLISPPRSRLASIHRCLHSIQSGAYVGITAQDATSFVVPSPHPMSRALRQAFNWCCQCERDLPGPDDPHLSRDDIYVPPVMPRRPNPRPVVNSQPMSQWTLESTIAGPGRSASSLSGRSAGLNLHGAGRPVDAAVQDPSPLNSEVRLASIPTGTIQGPGQRSYSHLPLDRLEKDSNSRWE